jgi:hypothetical protein
VNSLSNIYITNGQKESHLEIIKNSHNELNKEWEEFKKVIEKELKT